MQDLFVRACEELRVNLPCDFTGIALQTRGGTDIHWLFVSGNHNEKFKHITVRLEKGIAGKVISSGSPMFVVDFPDNILGKPTDYPIMLAEKLVSVIAVPLKMGDATKGVLLTGYRIEHYSTEEELRKIELTADEVEALLPGYFAG